MQTFNPTFKGCDITGIEAVDEKENVINDLEVSLEEMKIKPKKPLLIKEYKFALKATVNGGKFTITDTKTLRFGYGFIKDGWYVYVLCENDEVQ